jgi:hypothetical protein
MGNCRILHDIDNTFYWSLGGMIGWVNWAPTQIKVNYANQSYLFGTDGNDSFDANYYNYEVSLEVSVYAPISFDVTRPF